MTKSQASARAYQKVWYLANRARRIAYSKTWRAENPERRRIARKAEYAANSEQAQLDAKAWYADNAERARAGAKARYRAENPEHRRILGRNRQAHRRARIARVLTTLTTQEWEAILEAAGHACIYCGSQEQLSQEHLTPISSGGPHTSENVAPACLPCNQSKGAKTVMEFLAEKGAR